MAFPAAEFQQHIIEEQVPHSTALHARLTGTGRADDDRYLTGPLARYSLNSGSLPPQAAQAAAEAGLGADCRNPFRSIIVRAVEVVCAIEEALRLIEEYKPPAAPSVAVTPREGSGYGVSEAPRGVLYHRYELDGDGIIRSARIVPPTSQNQRAIEDDLRRFVQARLDFDDARLTSACEQAIRNYDPPSSSAGGVDRTRGKGLYPESSGRREGQDDNPLDHDFSVRPPPAAAPRPKVPWRPAKGLIGRREPAGRRASAVRAVHRRLRRGRPAGRCSPTRCRTSRTP
jgi:hypothetical protein